MFTVGEFSRIARVSKRLLRYYDQIGLFGPARTDDMTGYRNYDSTQLPELNRIISLKEMGFSLEEIQKAIDEDISVEELTRLLTLKKSEIEKTVDQQLAVIQRIESRLNSYGGTAPEYEIVLKDIEAVDYLFFREVCPTPAEGGQVVAALIESVSPTRREIGHLMFIMQSDGFEQENVDSKFGYILAGAPKGDYHINLGKSQFPLEIEHLAAVPMAATLAYRGDINTVETAYHALGQWIEQNGYRIDGLWREVVLDVPPSFDAIVMEIQVPVAKVAG